MRNEFLIGSTVLTLSLLGLSYFWFPAFYIFLGFSPFILLGIYDLLQKRKTILKNFPILGHGRYLMEMIRPEIQQYFVESNLDGRPISREQRSVIYQRAKGELQTLPFGTQKDVYDEGYEWVNHSLKPLRLNPDKMRVTIGNEQCKQKYSASLLNISAMSYGSLSHRSIKALNLGAKSGEFAHNTGEGGISPHHRQGGDLIWQIGTGYFGCRTADGGFCRESFSEKSKWPEVKMIELKLSQGAKPGHGGILPGKKVTKEISEIRGVPIGKDVHSPPSHSAFDGPAGLIKFIQELRDLSDGKPVGFKICIGNKNEFLEICQAMQSLKIYPDFITVDGSEGGTGAAPLEFSNSLGMPLKDGLSFVENTLLETNLRQHIKLIAAGKIFTAFDMIRTLALGADVVSSARGMMLALGCIHALRCNSNHCPTGVATNDPELVAGLDISDKAPRVTRYHKETVDAFSDLLGAMGLSSQKDLKREHVYRRISHSRNLTYEDIYPSVTA